MKEQILADLIIDYIKESYYHDGCTLIDTIEHDLGNSILSVSFTASVYRSHTPEFGYEIDSVAIDVSECVTFTEDDMIDDICYKTIEKLVETHF